MFGKIMTVLLAAMLLPVLACAYPTDFNKPEKYVTDADMGGMNIWKADTVYVIDGFVYVDNNEVLIIEPGTIVKGEEGQEENASALIVARGGQIYAVGTPCEPIIFTSILDDVWDTEDDVSVCGSAARSLWGGLILLGRASINDPAGWGQIEGIPATETRGRYGVGDGIVAGPADPCDNSGALKYVSVRHGGTNIGEANEINGVTFGAVGCGTQVDYVEVFWTEDDGFEWFGGTVQCNHLVAAFCGDDSFDYDEGFRGGGQFWFGIQTCIDGDKGGEHDGGGQQDGTPEDVIPYGVPLISNATYIGRGAAAVAQTFDIRDNAGVGYYNSVFTQALYGPKVETNTSFNADSFQRLLREQVKFYNCVWYDFLNGNASNQICNANNTVDSILFHTWTPANYTARLRPTAPAGWPVHTSLNYQNFLSTSAVIVDRGSCCADGAPDGTLDPRVTDLSGTFRNGSASTWHANGGWVNPMDANTAVGFHPDLYEDSTEIANWDDCCSPSFEAVDYPGAFDPDGRIWVAGWTGMYQYGYLNEAACGEPLSAAENTTDLNKPEVSVADADMSDFNHWSSNNVYVLQDFVYVDNGEVLYIEPGTVVKGDEGQEENAKALIVARGGKIYAFGSECMPVVLTSILDDVWDTDDDVSQCGAASRSLWGGLILLGRAPINDPAGWGQIEGIPATETRGRYGVGDAGFPGPANVEDNSGVVQYVSVRHGGTNIGEANEINGMTFGAVGRGTDVNHVEVFWTEDDGFEFFGGTVQVNYAIAAFCGDDGFDYDEGFNGGGQFWFNIQTCIDGDKAGEHDGGGQQDGTSEDVIHYATPLVSNATYIGRGASVAVAQSFDIRDNAGAGYYNSIFTEATYGPKVEKNTNFNADSFQRLLREQVKFYNCVWYGFRNGNTSNQICNANNTLDSILFHTWAPASYTSQLRPAAPGGWVAPGHASLNWKNFLSEACVINSRGDCCPTSPNGSLDPRATDLSCTFRNGDEDDWYTEGGWANPLNASDVIGFHPELYADSTEIMAIHSGMRFETVSYPGAFDPTVSLDESWATFSGLYAYGYLGDQFCENNCPSGCCVLMGNVDGEGDVTMGDLTVLIDHLFISYNPLTCADEGNVDLEGDVTMGDLTVLIDHLFISYSPLPLCSDLP